MSKIHEFTHKKMLYTAGPLRSAQGDDGLLKNMLAAREVMLELTRMGYAVFCPHTSSFLCGGALPDDYTWLDVDREIISRCDGVVFLPGWPQSEGSCCEREFAIANDIPCFDWTSKSHRNFLEQHALTPGELKLEAECEETQ